MLENRFNHDVVAGAHLFLLTLGSLVGVSLVAMLVMFAPNMVALLSPRLETEHDAEAEVQSAADQGNSELLDLIPLATGMAQAALLIFVRSASIRIPECTMDFVPALSALSTSILLSRCKSASM